MRALLFAVLVVAVCGQALYDDVDEARRAAEKDLAALGEEYSVPETVTNAAVDQAQKIAELTKAIPEHSDLTGIKVEMDKVPAVSSKEDDDHVAALAAKVVPRPVVDVHNEQTVLQAQPGDVVAAPRAPRPQRYAVRGTVRHREELRETQPKKEEVLRDPSLNLLDDNDVIGLPRGGTRPSAPQFGFGAPMQIPGLEGLMGQPNMGLSAPQMPQMPQMGMQMPQMPQMGMQMPQMPQMGMQMPQMPQMPQMGMQMPQMGMQMPQMPQMGMQMPQMGMQMPQMPQMPQPQLFSPELDMNNQMQTPQQLPSMMQQQQPTMGAMM